MGRNKTTAREVAIVRSLLLVEVVVGVRGERKKRRGKKEGGKKREKQTICFLGSARRRRLRRQLMEIPLSRAPSLSSRWLRAMRAVWCDELLAISVLVLFCGGVRFVILLSFIRRRPRRRRRLSLFPSPAPSVSPLLKQRRRESRLFPSKDKKTGRR